MPHTMTDIQARMRTYILYGILSDAVQNLFRPFAVAYLDRLGGDEGLMFLFNSLPALLAALVLIPSLILVRRLKNERQATVLFFFISRIFLLSFILVPLLPEGMRPGAFVLLYALMSMPDATAQSGLQSYLGHVFSPQERSTAIARRSQLSIPFALTLTIGTGLMLRFLPGNAQDRIFLYQVLFFAGFALAVLELITLLRLKGPVAITNEPLKLRPVLRELAHNRAFWGFAAASLVFHFGWQLGWPLFSVWHIKYLGADEAWLGLFAVISSAAMFLGYGFWEKIQKRIGLPLTLVLCTAGQALNPFFIGGATELWLQALANIPTGFFTAGVASMFLSGILQVTPDTKGRVVYLAVYNTMIYLSQVLSQELGHLLSATLGVRTTIFLDGGLRFLGAAAFGYRAWVLHRNARPAAREEVTEGAEDKDKPGP